MTPLRALVVDDEPLARRRLRALLGEVGGVEVAGEAEDVGSARAALLGEAVDVVFVDVQMPGGDGFAVVEALPEGARPFVVFVTAHAQHAVRAFEAGAVDYLLKPFDAVRLARSVERARAAAQARRGAALADEVRALAERVGAALPGAAPVPAAVEGGAGAYLRRFAVTVGSRTVFVPIEEVDWIEASGNYAVLHRGGQALVIRSSLVALERRLDPAEFARVHRFTIVRVDRVRELRALGDGDQMVVLRDGTERRMSARFRGRLPRE